MKLDPVTSQPYLMKKKIIRTPERFMGFYCLEMPVIALNCKKNTCHVPAMLSRELDQEFPLLTFSYICLLGLLF